MADRYMQKSVCLDSACMSTGSDRMRHNGRLDHVGYIRLRVGLQQDQVGALASLTVWSP